MNNTFRIGAGAFLLMALLGCQSGQDSASADIETRAQQEELYSLSSASDMACLAPSIDALLSSQHTIAQLLTAVPAGADPQPAWEAASPLLLDSLDAFLASLQQALLVASADPAACAAVMSGDARQTFIAGNPFAGTELASFGATMDALAVAIQHSRDDEPGDLPSQVFTLTSLLAQLSQAGADLLLLSNLNIVVAGVLNVASLVTADLYPLIGSLAAMDPIAVADNLTRLVTRLLGAFQPV